MRRPRPRNALVALVPVLGVGAIAWFVADTVHESPAERRQRIAAHCFALGERPADEWVDDRGQLAVSAAEAQVLAEALDDDGAEGTTAEALRARQSGPSPLSSAEQQALDDVARWQGERCRGVERRQPVT
ncbi:MAG TPA: hypothetical protein VGO60_05500 [Iamia sp.]|jgi:hypothetical protein|nr:hypothetical protein [Iamia sp.]